MELTDLSMLELAAKLAAGEVSSVEATRASLARIAQVDGKVKAFLRLDEKGALAAAEASDARRKAGNPASPLDGVPIGV
jgi:aspartyl-tRNA(Asn)/glutamyl-tRNA(Gln) amidotransferase subunit A